MLVVNGNTLILGVFLGFYNRNEFIYVRSGWTRKPHKYAHGCGQTNILACEFFWGTFRPPLVAMLLLFSSFYHWL